MAWLDLAGFLSGFWLDLALVWVGSGLILGLVLALVSVGFGLIWFILLGFGLALDWIWVGLGLGTHLSMLAGERP